MSFQNKGFWMGKGAGVLTDGEMAYDNSSRMEPKRAHQWFMDGSEAELFPNKKQAVDVSNNSFLGISNSNVPSWGNASGFHTVAGHFTDRLFDTEAARTINFDDRNITSVSSGHMNMGRKVLEDPFGNDSSFGLSMSHALEDPRSGLNYSGIRKVKVSQVKDSENILSASKGHSYIRGDDNILSMAHAYNKADDNTISMGLTYNKGDENIISMGDTFVREDNNFISMGQPYNKSNDDISIGHNYKGGETSISMGQTFGRGDSSILPMGQSYGKVDENTISMGQFGKGDHNITSMDQSYSKGDENNVSMGQFGKGDHNIISMGQSYSKSDENTISMGQFGKGDHNIISMGQSYSKSDENTISMGQFGKGDHNIISMGQSYSKSDENTVSMGQFGKGDHNIISMGQSYSKGDDSTMSTGHIYNRRDENTISMSDNNNLSMGHLYNKGDSNIISFGGYDDDTNPGGRLICSYDLLMGQAPIQKSEAVNEKELVESNADVLVNASQISSSGTGTVLKKKEEAKMSKKDPPNSFPSNVRSLLSTGMLDGVPVKYIAWSREKELRGVIKGSGYMCGCQSCNFSKVINAYEFERHAGCKTKHPNNHIYFENGKTIYGIVQELRSTPQNMLFEVIQTITGSPINQKSFRLWKESFLAATRELQRIYGKDEGKRLS